MKSNPSIIVIAQKSVLYIALFYYKMYHLPALHECLIPQSFYVSHHHKSRICFMQYYNVLPSIIFATYNIPTDIVDINYYKQLCNAIAKTAYWGPL